MLPICSKIHSLKYIYVPRISRGFPCTKKRVACNDRQFAQIKTPV